VAVTPKNYYALLDLAPAATADDVKRAFRQLIARYHPDKVQHLGTEFQELAAVRAAELTEAYRILSQPEHRAQYDAMLANGATPLPDSAAPAAAADPAPAPPFRPADRRPPPTPAEPAPEVWPRTGQFVEERATRDEFVRKATLERFRQAFLQSTALDYDDVRVTWFDEAWVPKKSRFARSGRPRLLVRVVRTLDAAAVIEAWERASSWNVPLGEEICVILMGTNVAPPRELADVIAVQRRKPTRGGHVTLIPVDVNLWRAHIPTDAPEVAKELLTRLNSGGGR
jgi:hypothetical protein